MHELKERRIVGPRISLVGAILLSALWGCSSTDTTGVIVKNGDGGAGGSTTLPDGGEPDAMANSEADIPLGEAITGKDGEWTYVDFPDAYCRDKTPAHIMAHLNSSSKKIAIYLEGGGACFNDASCKLLTFNAPSYVLGQGIFNFNRPENPIGDWNVFYVPYCTGDVHSGSKADGNPGPITGKQNYTGYSNLKLFLSRILATVPDATDEAIMGSSAGGFGTGLTADLVARNVPASVERFTLIDDSGQPMPSQYIVPCLQETWRDVWGLDATVLKDCGASCPNQSDYVMDWMQFLINKYAKGAFAPKFMGGLISWTGDSTISTFFGFGANDCKTTVPVPMTSAQFTAGILEFRATMKPQTDRFGTYYASGNAHTFLMMDSSGLIQGSGLLGGLYDTDVSGVKLVDWMKDLLDHKQAPHVGP